MSEMRYTADHEWVRRNDDGTIVFGITDFAQEALGDIVFLTLPNVGDQIRAGQACGEVESTKSVSDLFAPMTGEVIGRNEETLNAPEIINNDAYGQGWLVQLRPADANEFAGLLSAGDYEALTKKA